MSWTRFRRSLAKYSRARRWAPTNSLALRMRATSVSAHPTKSNGGYYELLKNLQACPVDPIMLARCFWGTARNCPNRIVPSFYEFLPNGCGLFPIMDNEQYVDLKDRLIQAHELCKQILVEDSSCKQICRYPLLTACNSLATALNAVERSKERHPKWTLASIASIPARTCIR